MRRPLFFIAAFFTMGAAYAECQSPYILVFLFIFLIYSIIQKCKIHYTILICISFAISASYCYSDIQQMNEAKEIIRDSFGKDMSITGKVVKKENTIFYLSDCSAIISQTKYPLKTIKVNISKCSDASVRNTYIGDIITTKGRLQTFDAATNEGAFDEEKYNTSLGITGMQEATDIYIEKPAVYSIREQLYRLKRRIKESCFKGMDYRYAGVAYAMVSGDKGSMDADEKQLYQDCGMSHILAVSGLHISIIGLTLYGFLRRLKFNYYVACPATVCLVLLYILFVGNQISALRAVIGMVILMTGYVVGRTYDGFTALGIAAMIILSTEPLYVTNSAFQLSFLAVLSVNLYLEYLRTDKDREKKKHMSLKQNLINSISLSLCVTLLTLPVLANNYHCIYPTSIILNILILPTTGVLMILIIIGGVTGLFVPFFSKMIFVPVKAIMSVNHFLMEYTVGLLGKGLVIGGIGQNRIAVYYLILGISFVLLAKREEEKRILGVLPMLICLGMVVFFPRQFTENLQMLDVGQGDGIYIFTSDRKNVFIDGGSTDVKDVGKYVIRPFLWSRGITRINYWFVSHTDEDHVSGLIWLMENDYKVDNIFLPETVKYEEDELSYRIQELAILKNCNVYYLKAGDEITTKNVGFYVMHPDKKSIDDDNSKSGDKNDNCLVMLYQDNSFSAILTGDMGTEQEEQIITELNELEKEGKYDGNMEVYKCAHHGSRYSNSELFLQKISPELSLVSCGRYNNYGHPSEEAVRNMKASGASIKFTMYQGQISVKCN